MDKFSKYIVMLIFLNEVVDLDYNQFYSQILSKIKFAKDN